VFSRQDCTTIRFHVFLPSLITLTLRATRNQRSNCYSLCRFWDPRHCAIPPTLYFHSTWNHRGNCGPILATVRFYCASYLAVFLHCPFTRTSIRSVYIEIQGIMPSLTPLIFRSTWSHRGNSSLFLATVPLYCTSQLAVFICYPATLASTHGADDGIQDTIPSAPTLLFLLTWDQRGDYTPILATMSLHCLLQLTVFIRCPATLASTHCAYVGTQDTIPLQRH
jgi:hypothetical protein